MCGALWRSQESETAQGLLASYISGEELSSWLRLLALRTLLLRERSQLLRFPPTLAFSLIFSLSSPASACSVEVYTGGAVPFGSVPKQASLGRNSNETVLSVPREPQSRQGPERSRGRSGRGGIVWVYCLSKIEARDLLSGKLRQRVGASYKRTPLPHLASPRMQPRPQQG